jgi:hypothetical protein
MVAEQLKVNMIIDGVNYPIGMAVTPEFRNKLPSHLRVRANFEPLRPPDPAVDEVPLEPVEEETLG